MMDNEELNQDHSAPLVPQPEAPLAESAPPPIQPAPETHAETETPEAETPAQEAPAQEVPAPAAEAPAPAAEAQTAQQAQAAEGRRRAQETWTRISGAKESGETISAKVKSEIKGGLLLDVEGYRAFLPASQTRVPKGQSLASLVGQDVPVKVIDVDQKRKRLVVSHRRAAESERRAARQSLLASLRVGEERAATVVRIADFGAFVDLGGVDALVPIGELAFERLEKPTDAVNIGDTFQVKVLRIDEGGKKIAVSRKAALPDPWRDHSNVLKHGTVTEGHVVAKEPRLQVEIAPGVIGSISDREANPEEYEIGEAIEVTVRSVDYRNRRIRLSTTHSASAFSSTSFAPLGKELGG
jgi:small subunit ribosomal protein S1